MMLRLLRSQRLSYLVAPALVLMCAGLEARGSDDSTRVRPPRRPPTKDDNDFYAANREPLLPNPLIKLPVGAVRPRGWLRHQLVLMSEGMTGRLPEVSPWCQKGGNAWLDPEGEGDWGWEELPYWLKGFGDLGYLLDDQRIIDEARVWIEGALRSGRPDGYFGPESNRRNKDVWPNMIMLNVLQSYYEYTGDERVIPLMSRYFMWELGLPDEDLLPGSWQKVRAGDNLESIYWLYNRTGDPWLLLAAEKVHRRTANWTEGVASWHGVNISQCFREPGQYYQQSRKRKHIWAAERNYREVMEKYGQVPGGLFGADENCREGYDDPRQAAETCSIVEMMLSDEILAGITGDPVWLDRCEEVAFNSLPAAMTPDLRGLHYLTAPNMIQLDSGNKSPGVQNGGCMLAYSPGGRYRCCQHNVSHGWPYFTEHLFMATRGNGLAAVLYAPCEVEAKVGGGATVRIVEETEYPFRDTIEFVFTPSEPVQFPFLVRIPGWCDSPRVSVNGEELRTRARAFQYLEIERTWSDGDRVTLELPMEVRVKTWEKNHDAVSVSRGPLTYSLKIGERWVEFGGTEEWPEWEVYPTSDWNYALILDKKDPAGSFEVVEGEGPLPRQPFDLSIPLSIRARARKVPEWTMDNGLVGVLQDSPVLTSEQVEETTLIPMGCARLRITAFPVTAEEGGGSRWDAGPSAELAASHVHDNLMAVKHKSIPDSSNDQKVSRFTWWQHRGTSEWIEERFGKSRKISSCEVYWFDDRGEGSCRVPASWKLLWRDGEEWKEVSARGDYGAERDRFNRVDFEPVETDAIRLEARLQNGYSGGLLRWRVD